MASSSFFPRGISPAHLYSIDEHLLLGAAEQVIAATLQGLVVKCSEKQIFIEGHDSRLWVAHLGKHYGIGTEAVSNVWQLVERCRDSVKGYVLYDLQRPGSLNAATALSGPLRSLAVDVNLEEQIRKVGITNRLADVSQHNELFVYDKFRNQFSSNITVELPETLCLPLRDYAVLANAFTFFGSHPKFRRPMMEPLSGNAACLGWGDARHGEEQFIRPNSKRGVFTVPADHARNLSVLSGVRETNLQQRTTNLDLQSSNVHYVCFLVTDGDNVQWNIGGMQRYFNDASRGGFGMGWGISPALVELAPVVMRWYYEHAHAGKDYFVAGPSGSGYFYPSFYPPAELDKQVRLLNEFMGRGGLNLVQILDFNSLERSDLWDKYTAQANIDGLFYMEYSRHDRHNGTIRWSNDKPVITPRGMLWDGLDGCDEISVAERLNKAIRDPSRAEGYSLVVVHVWSKKLKNVQSVVDRLDSDVRVVPPDLFVKLIQHHVRLKN